MVFRSEGRVVVDCMAVMAQDHSAGTVLYSPLAEVVFPFFRGRCQPSSAADYCCPSSWCRHSCLLSSALAILRRTFPATAASSCISWQPLTFQSSRLVVC